MKKTIMSAAVLAASAAVLAASLPSDGLQAQFRADDTARLNFGVAPEQWSAITNWSASGGALALTLAKFGTVDTPNYLPSAFVRADGTSRPGIRFGRNEAGTARNKWKSCLASTVDTDLGFTAAESHWFMAWRHLNPDASWRSLFGLYGSGSAGRRWDAIVSDKGKLSCYMGKVGSYASFPANGEFCVTDSRYSAADHTVRTFTNGVISASQWGDGLAQTNAMPFCIGYGSGGGDVNEMDIAEIAIYNRRLLHAEETIIREALAARWGAVAAMAYTGAAAGWTEELVGVGSSTVSGSGNLDGAVETSGDSDGLVLSVAHGSLDGKDGYVFAAHNGGGANLFFDAAAVCRRISRTWRVETTFETAPAVTLTFNLAELGLDGLDAGVLATASLAGKSGAAATFSAVRGVTPAVDTANGTVSFACAEGALADGAYTIAFDALASLSGSSATSSLPADGLQAQFRADDTARMNFGVAPGNWTAVTNWGAAGALSLVMTNRSAAGDCPHNLPGAFVRADGTPRPGLRFGRNKSNSAREKWHSYLEASDYTSLGLTTGEGTTFFAFKYLVAGQSYRNIYRLSGSPSFYFRVESANQLRCEFGASRGWGWYQNGIETGNALIDTRWSGSTTVGFYQGGSSAVESAGAPARTAQEVFTIGGQEVAEMDFAELAVYNRALLDAECAIVREALAARWGMPLTNGVARYSGAAGGWTEELVGVGSSTASGTGCIPGAVEISGTSKGLVLAVTSGSLDGTDGYVFAAASDSPSAAAVKVPGTMYRRLENTWRVEKSGLVSWPDLALAFNLSGTDIAAAAADHPAKTVLLRKTGGAFAAVDGVCSIYDAASGVLAFGCPAGALEDGVYTVAVVSMSGLSVILR